MGQACGGRNNQSVGGSNVDKIALLKKNDEEENGMGKLNEKIDKMFKEFRLLRDDKSDVSGGPNVAKTAECKVKPLVMQPRNDEDIVQLEKKDEEIVKLNKKIDMLSLELKSLLAIQLSEYFAQFQDELDPLALKILSFWFGETYDGEGVMPDMYDLWFGKSEFTDLRISFLFKDHLDHAASGLYDNWAKHPYGLLALVILVDQFPRNIFRNSARSFAYDWKALNVTWNGIEAKLDDRLNAMERVWFYLVFTHAEDLEVQRLCVKLSKEKLEGMEENFKKMWIMIFEKHLTVIEKFGRFPHRNGYMGRRSTKEEDTFKNDPTYRFDLPVEMTVDSVTGQAKFVFLNSASAPDLPAGSPSELLVPTMSKEKSCMLTFQATVDEDLILAGDFSLEALPPISTSLLRRSRATTEKAKMWRENNKDLLRMHTYYK